MPRKSACTSSKKIRLNYCRLFKGNLNKICRTRENQTNNVKFVLKLNKYEITVSIVTAVDMYAEAHRKIQLTLQFMYRTGNIREKQNSYIGTVRVPELDQDPPGFPMKLHS
jgi:hypothetical protein